jgi:hypothetical protein
VTALLEGLAVNPADPAALPVAVAAGTGVRRRPVGARVPARLLPRGGDRRDRPGAARHPRLPGERLLALLDDGELCGHAAANPALPVAVMHELLG